MHCNLPNAELTKAEWSRIEKQCKSQQHIGESESLNAVIATDVATLIKLNITTDQIADMLDTVVLRCVEYFERNGKYNPPKELVEQFKQLFEETKTRQGSYPIFGGKYLVFRTTYGGAEQCPFQSPEDTEYHGYEYGSHDWLVWKVGTTETFFFSDLLRHSIRAHQFFESSTKYRVDPVEVVNFFELKPDIDYAVKKVTISKWSLIGSLFPCELMTPDEFIYEVNKDKPRDLFVKEYDFGNNHNFALLNDGTGFINIGKTNTDLLVKGGFVSKNWKNMYARATFGKSVRVVDEL